MTPWDITVLLHNVWRYSLNFLTVSFASAFFIFPFFALSGFKGSYSLHTVPDGFEIFLGEAA